MVAFGEQQLDDQLALRAQCGSVRAHHHALGHFGEAGCEEFLLALDFHQAQAARAWIGEPSQVAEPRDVDAAFPRGGKDGLAFQGRDRLAVDLQRSDAHGVPSARAGMRQWPAGH